MMVSIGTGHELWLRCHLKIAVITYGKRRDSISKKCFGFHQVCPMILASMVLDPRVGHWWCLLEAIRGHMDTVLVIGCRLWQTFLFWLRWSDSIVDWRIDVSSGWKVTLFSLSFDVLGLLYFFSSKTLQENILFVSFFLSSDSGLLLLSLFVANCAKLWRLLNGRYR